MSTKQTKKQFNEWCKKMGGILTDEIHKGIFLFQDPIPSTGNGNTKSKMGTTSISYKGAKTGHKLRF